MFNSVVNHFLLKKTVIETLERLQSEKHIFIFCQLLVIFDPPKKGYTEVKNFKSNLGTVGNKSFVFLSHFCHYFEVNSPVEFWANYLFFFEVDTTKYF